MIDKDFFLGFIKVHILHHASKDEIYGVEILDELRRHGYSLSPGTLYPALHLLERRGYLKSRKEIVNGKVRKYYSITSDGLEMLEKSKMKIRELVDEVLGEKGGYEK
ncbi:MAG TPA: PadR family transcriptional regulator [Candidatus Methanoperedens sp.]|nr:PadR family transcriptional regulator [Candidatus Methanoperedens sp.]HLB71055.1 PadR family transcriptional regulator [Candidatus Methanoperedens sp.]